TDQELVLEALRLGACDYLAKPLHDEELVLAVRRAAESFSIANGWSCLRGRLDRLCSHMEDLSRSLASCDSRERQPLVEARAAEAACDVLGAQRTAFMLLSEDRTQLRVASGCGQDMPIEELPSVSVDASVAGLALSRPEGLLVRDIATDSRFAGSSADGRYRTGSFALAPIRRDGEPLGVLCATDRTTGESFDEDDLSLLRLMTLQLSQLMAVGRAGDALPPAPAPDEDSEADRDADLARIVCDAVVSEVEPERVLRAVLAPLARALPASCASIHLASPTGELRLAGGLEDAERPDRERLLPGRGLAGMVLETGRLVATPAPDQDPRFDPAADTPEDGQPGPLLCLPLRFRGKVVGLFRAFLDDPETASPRTGEVLSAALSAAVRNVLLYRSLVESIEEVAEARRSGKSAPPPASFETPS
ncbi:MAG: GAF domain-containing protein, partial [Proteobacteria bacterium]|nr:GAF domain-containing protein [Pseudomonadota bacterium]